MYSNAKHHVAPTAVLILILCVLSTNQTLFSRKKSTTPAVPVENVVQQSGPVPQKESSHWWQIKHKPVEPSAEHSGSNQVTVAVPVPIHQKLQSIFETHFNSDVKWVPCLCPMRKGDEQQSNQKQQPPQQQPQPQPQPQQHGPSYYTSTTEAPSDNNYMPRFIFANYPIEA